MHPKIDIHTHIIPEHLPRWKEKFGYGGFIHLEHHKPCCARMMIGDTFFREIEHNCWSGEQRIKECNDHRVHVQVLSTIPVLFNYWAKPEHGLETSQYLNDHIAAVVAQHPHRFIGLGTIPMQHTGYAVKEMERCVKELGFAGVQIGSNVNQENLNERKFDDIWAAAVALDACVFIHPWEMMGSEHTQKYWLPWLVGMPAETTRAICSMIFGGVFERFPKLRVAFAHGGGAYPFTIGRIEHGFNERPDLVAVDNNINPRNYFGKIYFDSLVHDAKALQYLVDVAGEDYVCLGTDYPFPLGELQPGKLIESMSWNDMQKQKLLWTNAERWLGRKINL
jgi:aminocarboxymuconate-semialdehyde decarboxylase